MTTLMLPIPAAFVESLQLRLRRISAAGAEEIIRAFGTAVSRDDTTLQLGRASLEVADACSGFSALYATVAFACILAYATVSRTRKAAILMAAVPASVGSNIVRCALLVLLVDFRGTSILATFIHQLSGILTILVAGSILLAIAHEGKEKPA
jgi:exosortase